MPLGTKVDLGPGNIVLDGNPARPQRQGGTAPPILAHVLWPNGCMDQGATWYWGRPRPRPHCVTWGPSSPLKGAHHLPVFGLCLLWPNGWMYQDATWLGGGRRPRRHCVTCGPSSTKGHSPQFSAHVCCGQTAGWMKIPCGMEVGLGQAQATLC